ncbi:MAG: zinc-binding dehydrogenase [Betaproteobacteria bacterium]
MATTIPKTTLDLRSEITSDRQLVLSLVDADLPSPESDEIIVRVEAAPINPSDMGLLFGAADMANATQSGSSERPVVNADVPERFMGAMARRIDQSLTVGNEGSGVVIATGDSPEAQALIGKKVAMFGGSMFTQYRCINVKNCLELPDTVTCEDGASAFVNPLTVLGFIDTLKKDGHSALMHTAAASNLGQMLNRICIKDGIPLVNIVRHDEHVTLLKSQGAKHVVNSNSETFMEELSEAAFETGATLGFDAIGGGKLAGQMLTSMESAANRTPGAYSRYGSKTLKQVYIYGTLDTSKTEVARNFGFSWKMGGWLLFNYMDTLNEKEIKQLHERVISELQTTFKSHYSKTVSLAEALSLESIKEYYKRSSGAKYLINPTW